MPYDKDKLAKILVESNPKYDLNLLYLEPALRVMVELDKVEGDFDITAVENAGGGPYLTTESARIAKIIGACHENGVAWVDKWNARVTSRTADEEAALDAKIMQDRIGAQAPPVEDDAATLAAKAAIDAAAAKIADSHDRIDEWMASSINGTATDLCNTDEHHSAYSYGHSER